MEFFLAQQVPLRIKNRKIFDSNKTAKYRKNREGIN